MSDTQSNTKRIAKNTLFLYFRMLLLLVISLYTSRVLLNELGVDDYGIYNVVGGRLNGFEGRLMSKKGSKFKRLLVDLQECNLSAAVQVESEYIQLLN